MNVSLFQAAAALSANSQFLVQENSTASKDNTAKTSKTTELDASVTSFFYSPAASGLLTKGGQLPALKFVSKRAVSTTQRKGWFTKAWEFVTPF